MFILFRRLYDYENFVYISGILYIVYDPYHLPYSPFITPISSFIVVANV